jgi:hypothetical protein
MLIVKLNRLLKSDKPENLHIVMYGGSSFSYCNQFSGFLFGRNEMGRFKRSKSTLPIFYNYLIIEEETNTPIYVGKGYGDRVLISNNGWSKEIGKETIYKFAFVGLREKEAFCFEQDLIFVIGRKDKGKGPLLNKTDGGEGFCGYIPVFTEDHRRKISEGLKGREVSDETRKRMSLNNVGMKGKKHSEETIKKMSLVKKGKKFTKEHRRKLSEAFKGRISPRKGVKLSEETKRKMSESRKGKKHSREHREKIRLSLTGSNNPLFGKTRSKETKEKISLAHMGKRVSEKTKKKMSISAKKAWLIRKC